MVRSEQGLEGASILPDIFEKYYVPTSLKKWRGDAQPGINHRAMPGPFLHFTNAFGTAHYATF